MIKARIFESDESLIVETEQLLRDTLATPGNLMLSGGSTPYVIYNRLAESPGPVHRERRIFLSDERMQPSGSDNNNAHNLLPMLQSLDCEDRFIRVKTELPIEEATAQFAKELEKLASIDIGLLGMGIDGHTAGFFTNDQANMKSGPLTLYTDRPDGLRGVSVSPALLHEVKRIFLLVSGESKRDIIHTLMARPDAIPAGIALADHPNVALWTDLTF